MPRAARSRRSARATRTWRNHVAYVACVARTGNDFREDGLISAARAGQDRAPGGQVPLRGEVRELAGPD